MRAVVAILLSLALVLALIAGAGIFYTFLSRTPSPVSMAPAPVPEMTAPPSPDPETAPLRRSIADLERRLDVLERRVDAAERDAPRPASLPDDEIERRIAKRIDEAVDRRLEELEAEIHERVARSPTLLLPGATAETEEERVAIVAENQAIATDRARTPEERLQALRQLRFRDGRSLEVTRAMIELIEDPTVEAAQRADIIRNLDGIVFDELKRPLIHSVLSDTDPEVREEAAETLGEYLLRQDDAEVADVLTRVRQEDGANRVREEAANQLTAWREER